MVTSANDPTTVSLPGRVLTPTSCSDPRNKKRPSPVRRPRACRPRLARFFVYRGQLMRIRGSDWPLASRPELRACRPRLDLVSKKKTLGQLIPGVSDCPWQSHRRWVILSRHMATIQTSEGLIRDQARSPVKSIDCQDRAINQWKTAISVTWSSRIQ